MFAPFPMLEVRRAGTPRKFSSPRDGVSFGLLDSRRFQAGPTVKVRFPRKESSDNDLRVLGDVDWTLEAGAFVEYWPADWLRGRVELRQGIGGHHGLVSDLMADVVVPVTPQLTLSGGPRLTLASASATAPYFSITPAQSAGSGLPVYAASGGLRSLGAGAQAPYEWSKAWATPIFIEYERLAGAAGNSPPVSTRGTRDQVQAGLGVTYVRHQASVVGCARPIPRTSAPMRLILSAPSRCCSPAAPLWTISGGIGRLVAAAEKSILVSISCSQSRWWRSIAAYRPAGAQDRDLSDARAQAAHARAGERRNPGDIVVSPTRSGTRGAARQ